MHVFRVSPGKMVFRMENCNRKSEQKNNEKHQRRYTGTTQSMFVQHTLSEPEFVEVPKCVNLP